MGVILFLYLYLYAQDTDKVAQKKKNTIDTYAFPISLFPLNIPDLLKEGNHIN
jgi:hypothetical protein